MNDVDPENDLDEFDDEEQEILALEKSISDLHEDLGEPGDDEILSEGEAAEVLSMLLAKKKTFVQTQKAKKNFELARGYGKGGGRAGASGSGGGKGAFRLKGGFTVEEVKRRTRCSRCLQLGHWWKECPNPPAPGRTAAGGSKSTDKEKEVNFVSTDEIKLCGFLEKSLGSATTDLKETETAEVAQPIAMDEETEVPLEATMVDQLEEPRRLPPVEPRREETMLPETLLKSPQLVAMIMKKNSRFGAEELPEQESGRGGPEPFLNLFHEEPSSLGEPTGAAAVEVYTCELDEIFRFENLLCSSVMHGNPQPADTACATIDTGCQRLAVGLNTLRTMSQHLPAPLKVKTQQQAFRFRSVHGVSTTERVGIVPASLDESGCFLRPALFEDEHGADAPFLLSLPLLMHCGATLPLCPEDGLFLIMKRSRRRIPCHLGPTGSLRVPIFAFTRRMLKALITQEKPIPRTSLKSSPQHLLSLKLSATLPCVDQMEGSSKRPRSGQDFETTKAWRNLLRRLLTVIQSLTPLIEDLLRPPVAASPSPRSSTTWSEFSEVPTYAEPSPADSTGDDNPEVGTGETGAATRPDGHPAPDGGSSNVRLRQGEQDLHGLHRGNQPRASLLQVPEPSRGTDSVLVLPMGEVSTDGGLAAWKFMENEMGVRRAPRDIIKDMVQEVCQHERTTRNGTNQYYERVTCLVCGKLVSQQARAKAKAQAKPVSGVPAKAPPPTLASTATSSTRTRTAPSGARTYEEQWSQFQAFMEWQNSQRGSAGK